MDGLKSREEKQHAAQDKVDTKDPPGDLSDASDSSDPTPTVIDSFRGEHRFLSNFYKSPIHYEGLDYPTVEHAYQAAKSLDKADKLKVLASNNPVVAKRVGKRVQMHPDFERLKLGIMQDIMRLKFARGSEFGGLLLATGNARLVEGNKWHDNYWGSCKCAKHSASRGSNHLGKILMRLRHELRSEKPADSTTSSQAPEKSTTLETSSTSTCSSK